MKFAFLFAAVSAITIQKNGPDSKNDPTNQYSIKVNDAHNAIQARSDADVAARNNVLDSQEKADAWRKEFNPKAWATIVLPSLIFKTLSNSLRTYWTIKTNFFYFLFIFGPGLSFGCVHLRLCNM